MKTILTAFLILLCGASAGVVANMVSYKLKWVKEPIPEGTTTTAKSESSSPDQTKVIDACVPKPEDKPNTVRMECVLYYLENGGAFIIDAREEADFVAGHLKGAIHLPASAAFVNYQVILEAGAQVDSTIIVYCGGGDCEASHNVAEALQTNGHQRVLIYVNGWQEIEKTTAFAKYMESGGQN